MRKIRGFKLALRPKEIARRAKKAGLDLAGMGLDAEPALAGFLGGFAAAARPSVLYGSFPAEGSALSPVPGLAFSLCLSTLGPEPEAFIAETTRVSPERGPLLEIAAKAALEETARFALGLIEAEAREERCELSPLQRLTEAEALKTAVERLEGHKIGVAAGGDGLRPAYSAAFSISWLSRSKSRSRT